MKSIVFIIPYYGTFPSYFQLWLDSCKLNPSVDWLIFTDIKTPYDYPPNVRIIDKSFMQLKDYIQSMFDFQIRLDAPYKFCDFKVAYGDIFQEYIRDYDYWGYCDIDVIWGDIRKFLTDKILDAGYDKIFDRGHCTLYRNTKENNQTYRQYVKDIPYYKDVMKKYKI